MGKKLLIVVLSMVMVMAVSVEASAKTKTPVPDPISEEQLALGAGVPTPSPIPSGSTSVAKAARKLINFGECWGWKASSRKSGKVIYVTLTNSKYTWDNIKIAKKKGKIGYWYKGTRYTLGGWKSSLKQYSNSTDRKNLLKNKAKQGANSIESYGKKQSWSATRTTKFKSNKAYVYLVLTNAKYKYNVTVVSGRENGKVVTTYFAENQKTTAKYIKENLLKYKATSKKSNGDAAYGSSSEGLPDGMTLLENNTKEVTEDVDLFDGCALSAPADEDNDTTVVTEKLLTTTDEATDASSAEEDFVELTELITD